MSLNKYTQLSYEERVIIENRLKNNESIRSIALKLDRNPSTIAREIKRNGIKAKTIRVNKPRELYLDSRRIECKHIFCESLSLLGTWQE